MANVEKVKGVLLDIEKDEAKVVEFEPRLQQYYDLLHCKQVEVVPRNLGYNRSHKRFDIVCDEEGCFKDGNKISAISNLGKVMFVGSLLIVNRADNGETASLTEKECEFVLSKIQKMCTRKHPEGYLMLTQCEY